MGRKSTIEDPVRLEFIVPRSQREGLEVNKARTGKSISEQVREALDNYLDIQKDNPTGFKMPEPMSKALKIVDYIAPLMRKKTAIVEIPYEKMMVYLELSWQKCQMLIRAFCSIMETKGIDVIWEPLYETIEIPGTTSRERLEKVGFRLSFEEAYTGKELMELKKRIEEEYEKTGKLDGNGRRLTDY